MLPHEEIEHPYYGRHIYRNQQQDYISALLKKFADHPVNDDLKKKVWEELMHEKEAGRLTIPIKLSLRRDATGKFPPYLEIILDTKV